MPKKGSVNFPHKGQRKVAGKKEGSGGRSAGGKVFFPSKGSRTVANKGV